MCTNIRILLTEFAAAAAVAKHKTQPIATHNKIKTHSATRSPIRTPSDRHVCLEWKLTYNWFSTRALLTEVRSHCACAAAATATATAIADCLSPHTNEDSASQSPSPSPSSSLGWLGYLCVGIGIGNGLNIDFDFGFGFGWFGRAVVWWSPLALGRWRFSFGSAVCHCCGIVADMKYKQAAQSQTELYTRARGLFE